MNFRIHLVKLPIAIFRRTTTSPCQTSYLDMTVFEYILDASLRGLISASLMALIRGSSGQANCTYPRPAKSTTQVTTFDYTTLYSARSLPTAHNLRRKIPPYRQLLEPLFIRDDEPFLIRQMQEADEAVARRDVLHLLLRIYGLKIVDHVRELQRSVS